MELQSFSVYVAPSGSLQDIPTMASQDYGELPMVMSLGATCEIHGMNLLIETSRRRILVFEAVMKSLRGMESR